jgi:hypothetical protein
MRSTSKRKNLIAQFDYPMRVTVRRGEFEPVESIDLLDVKKLGRGSHNVHIGSVTGGCCPSKTFATVRNGSVVDVYVEACKEQKKKLSKAVTEFFSSSARMARIVVSGWETDGGGCRQICWGSGPILDCVYCCVDISKLDCGFVQVIVGDVFQ